MTVVATENFDSGGYYSNLAAWSSNWTNVNGSMAHQSAGYANPNTSDEIAAAWNADSFDDDQYAEVQSPTFGSSVYVGGAVRCSLSAADYYAFYAKGSTSYFGVVSGGSWTDLGSGSGTGGSGKTLIGIKAEGTTITPYYNDGTSSQGAQTDTTLSSGYAGVSGYGISTTSQIDDWEGGNTTSSTPLTVQNASQAHSAGAPALTQHQVLVVAGASQAQAADSPDLAQHYGPLTVADAQQGHTAEAPSLTQHQVLGVDDASHEQTADGLLLVQHHVLTLADAAQAVSSDAPDLAQHYGPLSVDDAAQAQEADQPALTQHQILAAADAQQAQTAGSPDLVQHQVLVLDDASHAHTADNVVVTAHDPSSEVLVVQDATHVHIVDSPALVQHQVLAVQSATQAQSADGLVLGVALAVASALHAHTVTAPGLTQHHVLLIHDGTHLHAVDVVVLDTGYEGHATASMAVTVLASGSLSSEAQVSAVLEAVEQLPGTGTATVEAQRQATIELAVQASAEVEEL